MRIKCYEYRVSFYLTTITKSTQELGLTFCGLSRTQWPIGAYLEWIERDVDDKISTPVVVALILTKKSVNLLPPDVRF